MLDDILIPHAIPAKKVAGYQMPEDAAHLLSWDFVSAHLTASQHYWLTTIAADGQPHAVPVWGIWYRNRLHFEGGMKTAWARHLFARDQCFLEVVSVARSRRVKRNPFGGTKA